MEGRVFLPAGSCGILPVAALMDDSSRLTTGKLEGDQRASSLGVTSPYDDYSTVALAAHQLVIPALGS